MTDSATPSSSPSHPTSALRLLERALGLAATAWLLTAVGCGSSATTSAGTAGASGSTGGTGATGGAGAAASGGGSGLGGAAATGGASGVGGTGPGGAGAFTPHVPGTFAHPGTRGSRYELDFVKARLSENADPWLTHFNQAKVAGGDSTALGRALAWYLTGDSTYADAALAALQGWVGHAPYEPPPEGQGNQSSLEGAWACSVLAPAADILSISPSFSDTDKATIKDMFKTVCLPAMLQMSYWNGNCDLTQIDALLSVSVFLEDEASFQAGIERLDKRLPAYFYLSTDAAAVRNYGGSSEAMWTYPNAGSSGEGSALTQWIDGVTQETCRDNLHHAQFAIAAALSAMETAWLQGVDLYTPHQARMTAAMELMGKQLSSGDMQGVCANAVTTADRYNTLEIGYNHYHNRMGLALPETYKALTEYGATGSKPLRWGNQQFNMFHETLTHGDIVYAQP